MAENTMQSNFSGEPQPASDSFRQPSGANVVFVGNVSWKATERNLIDAFSDFGAVESVKIIQDRQTGKSKGFAFVTFVDVSVAEAVREKKHVYLMGKQMNVSEAYRRNDSSGKPSGTGAGTFGGAPASSSSPRSPHRPGGPQNGVGVQFPSNMYPGFNGFYAAYPPYASPYPIVMDPNTAQYFAQLQAAAANHPNTHLNANGQQSIPFASGAAVNSTTPMLSLPNANAAHVNPNMQHSHYPNHNQSHNSHHQSQNQAHSAGHHHTSHNGNGLDGQASHLAL